VGRGIEGAAARLASPRRVFDTASLRHGESSTRRVFGPPRRIYDTADLRLGGEEREGGAWSRYSGVSLRSTPRPSKLRTVEAFRPVRMGGLRGLHSGTRLTPGYFLASVRDEKLRMFWLIDDAQTQTRFDRSSPRRRRGDSRRWSQTPQISCAQPR